MRFNLRLKSFFDSFLIIVKKYPLSVFIVIFSFFINLFLINGFFKDKFEEIISFSFLIYPIILLSFSLYLFSERKKLINKHLKVFLFSFLYFIFLYFFVGLYDNFNYYEEKEYALKLTLIYLITLFLFLIIPIFDKKIKNKNFYNFFLNFVSNTFSSIVVLILTFFLLFLAFKSLEYLFNFNFNDDYFFHMINFSTHFSILFFLTGDYWKYIDNNEKRYLSKFSSFLVEKIGFIFISIYFLILYAYTFKILINFSAWPNGVVAWLVIWFSVLGIFIYILSFGQKENNKFASFYYKYFPLILFPQVLILFYSTYLRISEYGMTINRMVLVSIGIFFLLFSIYYSFYSFKKDKKARLSHIVFFLLGISLFLTFAPKYNLIDYPLNSQIEKLKKIMIENNLLSDGRIQAGVELSSENKNKIISKIDYICFEYGCDNLIKISEDFDFSSLKEWEKRQAIKNKIGFGDFIKKYNNPLIPQERALNPENFYQNTWFNFDFKPIYLDLDGYKAFYHLSLVPLNSDLELKKKNYVVYDRDKKEFIFYFDEREKVKMSLRDLIYKNDKNVFFDEQNRKQLSEPIEFEKYRENFCSLLEGKYEVCLADFDGSVIKNIEDMMIYSASFYILIK